jgi:hypothetical protein
MRTIQKIFSWGCACTLLVLAACTADFKEINTNPNTVPYEKMLTDNLFTGSAIAQMENYCVTTDANQYQRSYNLAGDMFGGYFSPTNVWTYSNTYNLYAEWYNVAFDVAYSRVMSAWRVLDLIKDENAEAYSLAQILKVYGMHKVTDMYGPIPYSQFGKAEVVPYDGQEAIYDLFLTELTDAVNVLTTYVQTYPDARPLKSYDAIYAGDYSKWIKFANTLKLRLAMRIAYANPTKAKQMAEEAVSHTIGTMTANADNAFYPVPQRNPLNEIWDAYEDTRMGATLECYMNGFADPRRPVYFTAQPYNGIDYRGVRISASINATRRPQFNARCALPNVAYGDPLQWMVAAEAYFLRAEGAVRGWSMGGTAGDLYNLGIQTSFDQNGVSSSYATYVANNTSVPTNYTCPVQTTNNYTYSPANTITIAWNDGDTNELKLERIITQKWLAIYPDGQEAWSEFRRTGYPKLIPVRTNSSGGTIDTDIQIRRLPFPTTEYANNAVEVQAAVDNLLNGPDNGGTKLWWDKK